MRRCAVRLSRSAPLALAVVVTALAVSALAPRAPAAAQTTAPPPRRPPPPQGGAVYVDPAIREALAGRVMPPPWLAARGARPERDHVAVVIELRASAGGARSAALASLDSLANEGVALRRPEGRAIAWGRWVPARIDARGLDALSRAPFVAAVHLAPRTGLPPLDRSGRRISLEAARGAAGVVPGAERITGAGTVIADLDAAIDLFHPAFFHADAGWFDWIDVDGDGVLTAGVDAIDLDRDGVADDDEIALVLRAAPTDFALQPTGSLRRGAFDPSIDWLFLDRDGDLRRDSGVAAGYGDDDPALGEPLFVPDDLDGDGLLDPEERVVRLGTSKVRAYYVAVRWGGSFDHVYRRGVDLAEALRDYTGGAHGYADTLHGTGVAGILIGDVPLVGRRWVGIAPGAELVHAFQIQDDSTAQLAWALGEEPDVVLHEYVLWTRTPLDGSDALATMIDDSSARAEVAHVCPAGNIGGTRKHAVIEVDPGASVDLPFRVDDALQYVEITIHDALGRATALTLIEPGGTEHAWGPGPPSALSSGAPLWMSDEATSRGFRMRGYTMYDETGSLPIGAWRVRVRGDASEPTTVHAFLADERGFALGAAWDAEIATDRSTIAWPATADACLGVGAVPSHTSDEGPWYGYAGTEAASEVRAYSARGPRIDGFASLGIVAPDNPWSALGAGDVFPSSPGALVAPEGAYQVFGGTSGAGPHVAGVAALLAQRGLRGAAALDAIRAGASRAGIGVELPDDDYGAGTLDAAGALGVIDARGSAPVVTLRAEPTWRAEPGEVELVIEASDDDRDALELRWDDGYDGTWEGDFTALAPRRAVRVESEGVHRFKVRVRDATGRIAEAAALVRVGGEPPAGLDAGVGPDGGVGGGGSEGCACRAGASRGAPQRAAWIASLAIALAARRTGRRRRRA